MKIQLKALALAVMVAGSANAEDLKVPHSFTSGTPIKSSEMNENFSIIYSEVNTLRKTLDSKLSVKANGTEIGRLIDKSGRNLTVISQNGYFFRINTGSGEIISDYVYFPDDSCSGTSYSLTSGPGDVIRLHSDKLVYISKTAIIQNMRLLSHSGTGDNCHEANVIHQSLPTTPNDPQITGVYTHQFSMPISIE